MQSIKQILYSGKSPEIENPADIFEPTGNNFSGNGTYVNFGIENTAESNLSTPKNCTYDENKNQKDRRNMNGFEQDVLSDTFLKTLVNLSTDIITLIDTSGIILYESNSIESMLGYKPGELIGKNAFSFIHRDDLKKVQEDFYMGINSPGKSVLTTYRFRKFDGTYAYLESTGTRFNDYGTNMIVVISRDVTSRINAEKDIKRLSTAVEQSSNTVVITDVEGKIEYVNKKFSELTGYSKQEVIGKNPSVLRSLTSDNDVYKDLWTTILTGKVWEGELKNKKKNGDNYWERIKITPVIDELDRITGFIAVKDDITKERKINEKLSHSLKEKEIMLKEIHHRVKNNLQVVISLLSLQANSSDDIKLKNQLTISQNRVRAMALLHQLLYRANDLAVIEMEDYIIALSGQLLASYSDMKDNIKIKIDAPNINFSIDTAVPFGLLVNELISNSLKHGFPEGRTGTINLELHKNGNNDYSLSYSDDGIGMPYNMINSHSSSFGMNLIDMLVSQLDGNIKLNGVKGTNYKINFRGSSYQTRL